MRTLFYAVIGVTLGAGCCASSATAQTQPDPDLTLRQCVIAHLPALAAAVREHMKAYHVANPQATQAQAGSEREAFIKVTRAQHADEVAAAKTACQAAAKT